MKISTLFEKKEYWIPVVLAIILQETALFYALYWFWSGFEWSPLGCETCGLEGLVYPFIIWPTLGFAFLLKSSLWIHWKQNISTYLLPIAIAILTLPIFKSLELGYLCAVLMIVVVLIELHGIKKARHK